MLRWRFPPARWPDDRAPAHPIFSPCSQRFVKTPNADLAAAPLTSSSYAFLVLNTLAAREAADALTVEKQVHFRSAASSFAMLAWVELAIASGCVCIGLLLPWYRVSCASRSSG